MREIIEWLIDIEGMASRVYTLASARFKDDQVFAEFLNLLSEDEATHHDIMCKAAGRVTNSGDLPTVIYLKDETKKEVESYLELIEKRIASKEIDKHRLIDYIISIEYSTECNDLFMYVVNTLKHRYSEFTQLAAKIQRHRRNIERFIESHSELSEFSEKIRSIPRVWQERLLVVDGNEDMKHALSSILEREGLIDGAPNGREALEKICRKFYAAIITNVSLPGIDGIELFNRCRERYPSIQNRLLFFSNDRIDKDRLGFLEENNLKYLCMPAHITDIKNAVVDILKR